MNDENDYQAGGETIEQLYALEQDDPWKIEESSDEKRLMDEMAKIQEEIFDHFKKEGLFPPAIEPDADMGFVDPEDDEDLRISFENSLTQFWRVVVPNRRIIELVAFDPTLPKIALVLQNNAAGCWMAFTSRRIAQRVVKTLDDQGIFVTSHTCDITGTPVGADTPARNKTQVDEWRPWKPVGPVGADPEPKEFFYCLADYDGTTEVYIVPESYWNENHTIFDGDLGITKSVKSHLSATAIPWCFTGNHRDMLTTKAFLDQIGFMENLLFQVYVNECL